ncbi:MAG TPA: hypothetical protein VL137_17365 [Polyangiaceae bacterium]|nr:hypothetical protein [Polyangiaceae bacterium]
MKRLQGLLLAAALGILGLWASVGCGSRRLPTLPPPEYERPEASPWPPASAAPSAAPAAVPAAAPAGSAATGVSVPAEQSPESVDPAKNPE